MLHVARFSNSALRSASMPGHVNQFGRFANRRSSVNTQDGRFGNRPSSVKHHVFVEGGVLLLYRPGIISSSSLFEIFRVRKGRKDRMIERLLEATEPASITAGPFGCVGYLTLSESSRTLKSLSLLDCMILCLPQNYVSGPVPCRIGKAVARRLFPTSSQ